MLTDRQATLLDAIVREYIKTAEPVASLKLSGGLTFSVSPATIRNDMAALEEAGFLSQPHTSAGRIPTEAGYRFYIEHCLGKGASRSLPREELSRLNREAKDQEQRLKEAAKILAECTGEAVLVSLDRHDVYYTGLSHLLEQPEFHELARFISLTNILDRLPEVMRSLYDQIGDELEIRLGSDNPFGVDYGTIVLKVRYGHRPTRIGLLGLVGPMRMDYERNRAILEAMAKHLQYG